MTIKEADVAPLQVQGPKSKDLMVKLLGESILDLKYYFWTHAEIAGRARSWSRAPAGRPRSATRSTRPRPRKGNDVYEALMKAGEEFNIKPTGPSDIRRIEGAIFNWGADMTYDNNPIEMGLDRLVDWDTLTDDACISLAALKKIRDAGVGRKIVGVEMDGEPFEALNNVKWPVTRRRRRDRQGHVGDLLAAPGEEHRVRLGADAVREPRHVARRLQPNGATATPSWSRCRSSTRRSRSRWRSHAFVARSEAPFGAPRRRSAVGPL